MSQKEYPWQSHGEWKSRILDKTPEVTTYYFYNEHEDKQFLHEVWDVKQGVEAAKASFAATDSHASWSFDEENELGTKVAWVPNALLVDLWQKSNGGKDQEVLNRWVMDPENRHFLTRPVLYGIGRAVGGDITR